MTAIHLAEDILPGHPDRLADAVAESIVDLAVARDPDALVGVEVGVHRDDCFITGRVAASGAPLTLEGIEEAVHARYAEAGYRGTWTIAPRVISDLVLDPLGPDERGIRRYSDDQSVVVGHASGSEATGYLPPAVWLARRLRERLSALRNDHDDVLGPDGKVLVRLREEGGRFHWERCNIALQHAAGVGYEELHRLVLGSVEGCLGGLDGVLPGLADSWRLEALRLNGAGDFSCGGPHGDNGLSGKKLAVDFYGPTVPLGGGALCGKDGHKVDRIGALCARELAVRLFVATGARGATVWLTYVPGLDRADAIVAQVDGVPLGEAALANTIAVPSLAIPDAFDRLGLSSVSWLATLRAGYFGNARQWERTARTVEGSAPWCPPKAARAAGVRSEIGAKPR